MPRRAAGGGPAAGVLPTLGSRSWRVVVLGEDPDRAVCERGREVLAIEQQVMGGGVAFVAIGDRQGLAICYEYNTFWCHHSREGYVHQKAPLKETA